MINALNFILRGLASLAGSFSSWASRLAGAAPAGSQQETGQNQSASALRQPFTGGPEEAMALAGSPPIELQKKKALTSVQPDGQIPEASEAVLLTAAGKVMGRVDYIVLDDFGLKGDADHLRGRCLTCRRVSFRGSVCAQCGEFSCHGCGGTQQIDGQVRFLCKRHLRAAEFNRDLWGTQERGPSQTPSTNA